MLSSLFSVSNYSFKCDLRVTAGKWEVVHNLELCVWERLGLDGLSQGEALFCPALNASGSSAPGVSGPVSSLSATISLSLKQRQYVSVFYFLLTL